MISPCPAILWIVHYGVKDSNTLKGIDIWGQNCPSLNMLFIRIDFSYFFDGFGINTLQWTALLYARNSQPFVYVARCF